MQRYRLSIVIITGLIALVVVFALASSGGSTSRAEEGDALLQMPDFPPTPTIPPAPTSAPALQSGSTLFSASFDSADSLNSWQIVDLGEVIPGEESVWRVADGYLQQDRTARAYNPDFRATMALTGDTSWSNYTVSSKVYDAANATVGLVARRQGNSFYRFRWFANGTEGDRKLVLEKVVDGEVTTLAEAAGPGYDHHRWYTISLRVNGSQIQTLIDNTPALSANDSTLTSGQAGVTTIAFGAVSFDDVIVTAP